MASVSTEIPEVGWAGRVGKANGYNFTFFFHLFFLLPIFVFFAEKVNPRWLQLNLFFLLFLGIPLST